MTVSSRLEIDIYVKYLSSCWPEIRSYIRLVDHPTALPATTGIRTATAGFSKQNAGSVKEGMYVVISS